MNAASALLLLALTGSPEMGQLGPREPEREVSLLNLASVRRLFTEVAQRRLARDEGVRVAAWSEFSLLVEAVVGEGRVSRQAFEDLDTNTTPPGGPIVRAAPGVRTRDESAYTLLALGYSAREAADVISGRISKQALDTAQHMLLAGRGRDAAEVYLDSQYQRLALARTPPNVVAETVPNGSRDPFDATIQSYARVHGVDASLVRAVIATESNFDPAARSRAGAIGLMQLMPETARALGVDPLVPDQNIEGGVRYLSELIKMFGGVELALVAYNAGPGFARRYAHGAAALYGETRAYVKEVMARTQRR